jgi:two-component system, chemotaxis family, sensor kinase CheA
MEKKTEYRAIFSEEAGDLLREWEECLLALDRDPRQPEPLNGVFRAVHTLKGSVALDVDGEDTEIDKKVIDRIGEPLVHLVRNAVDHGMETAAERAACGKPPGGTVRLSAFQDRDHICIQVSDDGRGVGMDAVKRTVEDMGGNAALEETVTEVPA